MRRSYQRSSDIGQLPEVNSVFRGEVTSLQPYGIFVKIPGCEKNGLVHISQISNSRVERPEDVVELRERIYCKVISVEVGSHKISLSMKGLNQTTGEDENPNQIQTNKNDRQRNSRNFQKEDSYHRSGEKKFDLFEDKEERGGGQQSRREEHGERKREKDGRGKSPNDDDMKKEGNHSDFKDGSDSSSDNDSRNRKTEGKDGRRDAGAWRSRSPAARSGPGKGSYNEGRDQDDFESRERSESPPTKKKLWTSND